MSYRDCLTACASAWRRTKSLLVVLELIVPSFVRVVGCDTCVAVRAGVMVVHHTLIPPDIDCTGNKDYGQA